MNEQKTPAYRRVLEDLRDLILTGKLREGDRIPSAREITARYGVPSETAARAIAELRAEGLIITRHGTGAFAASSVPSDVAHPCGSLVNSGAKDRTSSRPTLRTGPGRSMSKSVRSSPPNGSLRR